MSGAIDSVTGEIDWPAYKARMQRALQSPEISETAVREMLAERSRRLAQRQETAERRDAMAVLAFRLGRERYALETRFILEVRRLTEFTPIPGAPGYVVGATNLRGDIVAVFDLRLFFGLSSSGMLDRSQLIFIGGEGPEFAVIADVVEGLTEIESADFVPDAVFDAERGRDSVRGITKEAMIVLDGDALKSEPRLGIGLVGDVAP